MDLEESQVFPFTTPTTCFSSSPCSAVLLREKKKNTGKTTSSFRFATENHVLGVCSSSNQNQHQPVVLSNVIHRDNHPSTMICVGYAQYPAINNSSHNDSNGNNDDSTIQALALIDPLVIHMHRPEDDIGPFMTLRPPLSQQQQQQQQQPTVTTTTTSGDGSGHHNSTQRGDDGSVTSMNFPSNPPTQQGSKSHSRGSSLNSSASALTTTFASSTTTGLMTSPEASSRNLTSVDQHQQQQQDDSAYRIPTGGITSTASQLLEPPKARLILQVPCPTDQDCNSASTNMKRTKTTIQEFIALLRFRPLSPCLAQWDDTVGIFVGSADDSKLRFYHPPPVNQDGSLPHRRLLLARRSSDGNDGNDNDDFFPKTHFEFESPIMGIDFYSNVQLSEYTLAVVGQDGTIQLITWSGRGSVNTAGDHEIFGTISSHQVIVDGPLVSVHIQPRLPPSGETQDDEVSLRVVIGSLYGYVCTLTKRRRHGIQEEWTGPEMIVQGLWNPRIGDEDSVMAVCALEDCIALGTFGGRCLIYQKGSRYNDTQPYRLLWERTLPYSIHGLELRNNTENGSFEFWALTRRSLHIFTPTISSTTSLSLPPAKFSINKAKERLKRLLERPPPTIQEPMKESLTEEMMMEMPFETDAVTDLPDIGVATTKKMMMAEEGQDGGEDDEDEEEITQGSRISEDSRSRWTSEHERAMSASVAAMIAAELQALATSPSTSTSRPNDSVPVSLETSCTASWKSDETIVLVASVVVGETLVEDNNESSDDETWVSG